MKNPEKQPRKDEAAETAKGKAEKPVAKDAPKAAEGNGLDYKFKISPADPKNNLDFEDVADK